MSKELSIIDALILQEEEDVRLLNGRTRKAINHSYGPKQPTKFRRNLPGKRHWKNKDVEYRKLNRDMDERQQKAFERAQDVLTVINKKKQEKFIKKMAKSSKAHPLHD